MNIKGNEVVAALFDNSQCVEKFFEKKKTTREKYDEVFKKR